MTTSSSVGPVIRIGDVTVQRVDELVLPTSVRWLLPDATREETARCSEWLQPHFQNADGFLLQSIHTFVVKTPTAVMLVDTGVGNGKDRPGGIPQFHHLDTPYLERLAALGVTPEGVDFVLCTHIHGDHCGWNARLDGDRWVPTFPRARHLFARPEYEYWTSVAPEQPATERLLADSVRPVVEAGLADLVAVDHVVSPEVRLVPMRGHTPGHVVIEIESRGARAVITGDVMHSPIQCAFPDLASGLDRDKEAGAAGRRAFLARYADTGTIVLGSHFGAPSVGRVTKDGAAWRFDAALDVTEG